MQKLWRRSGVLLIGLACLGLTACGEDPDLTNQGDENSSEVTLETICREACENIYDTCGTFLVHSNGSALTERTCRNRCIVHDEFRGFEECMITAECKATADEMVMGCFPEGLQAPACEHLGLWPRELEQMEVRVLEIVNERRAEGATCGNQTFGPADPVTMDETLRCAARLHSVDMVERDYFDHSDPDGVSPFDRMEAINYTGSQPWGENIAAGYPTPEDVMQGWMDSPGHCANIMTPGFKELGVGLFDRHWTQKFGGG